MTEQPKDVIIATKLASLIKAPGIRQMWGTIIVTGVAREVTVVCHDHCVGLITTFGHEGETLPKGLTYAQLAAHISKVANEQTAGRIGSGYRAQGSTWEAVGPAPVVL